MDMTRNESQPPLVVLVAGAGYAGVMAANRLAGHARAGRLLRLRLVSPGRDFVERVRLHRALPDGPAPLRPLRELLHPAVEHVPGTVALVDRERALLRLGDGRELPFDRLILATGSRLSAPPGALPLDAAGDLPPLRPALDEARRHGLAVRIAGGGATGVEAAARLAQLGFRVEIADPGLVAGALGPHARERVRAALRRLGCRMLDGRRIEAEPGAVTLWATGPRPVLPRISPEPARAADGRLAVDAALRLPEDPRILAAGDCAAAPGAHLGTGCATALPMGAAAADTIAAEALGLPAPEADIGYLLRCLSLGERVGIAQLLRPDGAPRGPVLGGRVGGAVRELLLGRTSTWLRAEARRPGSFRTVRGPRPGRIAA